MELTFQFGNEIVLVRISNGNITFSNSQTHFQQFFPIDNIHFKRAGMIKEHPDLKELSDNEMRVEVLKRFKKKIGEMENQEKIKDYVIKELESQGYVLKMLRRKGFRPQKFK